MFHLNSFSSLTLHSRSRISSVVPFWETTVMVLLPQAVILTVESSFAPLIFEADTGARQRRLAAHS
jgi:hypothetical protein